jgi:hypothetical protein
MIEEARRPGRGIGIDDTQDPALRLASETIRLARLAASAHMVLAAPTSDGHQAELVEPPAARGHLR